MTEKELGKAIRQSVKKVMKMLSQMHSSEAVLYNPAYLILTSKFEHPFRDLLACALREVLTDKCEVSREYDRHDIVIFNKEGKPLKVIELKAIYAFDCKDKGKYFRREMERLKKQSGKSGNSILLITTVKLEKAPSDRTAKKTFLRSIKYIQRLCADNQKKADDALSIVKRFGFKKAGAFEAKEKVKLFEEHVGPVSVHLDVYLK